METSPTLAKLAEALGVFHLEVKPVKKSAENPFFKSSYADLSSILAVQAPLLKAKLSFVQFPVGENTLTTMLMHESGEWMRSNYTLKPVKADPQSAGSAITYARRYALGAILGLSTEEDDDGAKASNTTKKTADKEVIDYDQPPFEDAPITKRKGL